MERLLIMIGFIIIGIVGILFVIGLALSFFKSKNHDENDAYDPGNDSDNF
jgi:uncharacterized protein YxeA